ncbi:hypothetical protein B9Z55_013649 [Caenorhabditis nigoni]|uniref:Uncharacterized protein n=1 Tax=Caenorhabditis nigoni TaxID=1611254 RepID=A0A2G5U2N0_9PELO|nr:hypothetical protein B9Z55_013649 [Caenorhabditis nigoni]
MNLQKGIQKFWFWILINFSWILVNFQVFSQELKLFGSMDMGILPGDAKRICEKIGGNLATLTDENRQFFENQLFKNCSTSNDFCPKMCFLDKLESNKTKSFNSNVMMTQPIYPGDTLHLKLEIENHAMEVIQISDSLLEENTTKVQNVALRVGIYNKYPNNIDKSSPFKKNTVGITVGSGTIIKSVDGELTTGMDLAKPKVHKISKKINKTVELTFEFTTSKQVRISSPTLFGDDVHEQEIGKLHGRMYFKKFYEVSKILDAYFTRGNCSKSDFYHFNDTEFVNCHRTRPTVSIQVYSCRKASFVACENVIPPPKTTTAPIPTTSRKIQKNTNNNDTVVPEISHDFQEDVRPTEPSYFHVEFLDEHIMFFVTLSGFSVALLVASIVLQAMKIWQNRKLKIVKKKKK